MSKLAIRAEALSKRYKIGIARRRHDTLRDQIVDGLKSLFRRNGQASSESETFWALKDISFEVQQGEVVGIIGRNGAGKSTLLKILSRITPPTAGRAEIFGRVGSLLEVGTGFHPELTGRENIYLNGAVLGMKKAEISRKFDEIVAFSEIERFLDTPVKHYSSGMYVRLAFAVAAHLEPEVLIVDEVLAVGDARFQKKCLGKMGEVANEGRTVLYVSHNMAAVAELCQRAILLHEGGLVADGTSQQVITQYVVSNFSSTTSEIDLSDPSLRRHSLPESYFKWTGAAILDSEEKPTTVVKLGQPFEIILKGFASAPIDDLNVGFGVTSTLGFTLFNSYQTDDELPMSCAAGVNVFRVKFDPNILGPGTYYIDFLALGTDNRDWIPDAIHLTVSDAKHNSSVWVRRNFVGVIRYPCKWTWDQPTLSTSLYGHERVNGVGPQKKT